MIWYSDEEICKNKEYQSEPWVQTQKQLVKLEVEGFFTVNSLQKIKQVRKGITGFDPDCEGAVHLVRTPKKAAKLPLAK